MSQPPQGQSRVCPTRIDDRPILFAHKVSKGQCQDRQRGRYHKCYTCAYNNAQVAVHGLPPEPEVEVAAESAPEEERSAKVETTLA